MSSLIKNSRILTILLVMKVEKWMFIQCASCPEI